MKYPKIYNSIFVPEEKISLPACIAEILIKNYVVAFKKKMPTCPFWRKEYVDKSTEIEELANRYKLEIIGAQALLKKFDPEVIIKYFVETKCFAFKFRKKPFQEQVIQDLTLAQKKFTEQSIIAAPVLNEDVEIVTGPKKFSPKKGKMSL